MAEERIGRKCTLTVAKQHKDVTGFGRTDLPTPVREHAEKEWWAF